MGVVRDVVRNFCVAGEIFSFFGSKRWWLLPLLLVLLLLGALIVLAQSSAVGPFIYTLF